MRYRKPSYPYQPELTLKTNLVQRVLRKLRQPNIFCKFAKTSFEHCQPVFVCVLLAIGMATVQPRRMAVNGGALRFANQLHSSSLQIGGGQDEATVSTRPRTSKKITKTQNFLQVCKDQFRTLSASVCVCAAGHRHGHYVAAAWRGVPRRGVAVDGGALRFANQLRSSSLQIGGGQDEAAVSTRPTTSKQPPQPPTHTLQLCSVVILREKPQFSRGCSVSCR